MPTLLPLKSYSEAQVITPQKPKKSSENMLEKFELLDLLGEGAFAKVFKCMEKESKRFYAAKKIDFHEDNQVMIENEIEVLKGLRHENIVSLHTSFSDGSSYFVVMEYVDSGNLFDEIIGQAVYSEQQACRIIKQVSIKYH